MTGSILLFVAGLSAIPALLLGLWLAILILNARDRHRATFKFSSSVKYRNIQPDLTEYPVKINKVSKGYRIEFIEYDDDLREKVGYVVEVKKVDPPSFD